MEQNTISLTTLWTAAGILLGFQINSIRWRIGRETKLELETKERIWLPPHDYLNLASILVTSGGVFLLPALGVISHDFALMAFAVSIIFLCGYVFAAFGHYELYRPHKESRKPFPFQEKVPVAITIITVVYLVHQWFLFPPT